MPDGDPSPLDRDGAHPEDSYPDDSALAEIDGSRTTKQICITVAQASPGGRLEDVVGEVLSFLDLLVGLGLLLLRRGDLAPIAVQEIEREWNGAIDLRSLARCQQS